MEIKKRNKSFKSIMLKIGESLLYIIVHIILWLVLGLIYIMISLGGEGPSDREWLLQGIPSGIVFIIIIIAGICDIWVNKKSNNIKT